MVMQRTANPLKSVQFRSRPPVKQSFSSKILQWYDENHRSFPWRIPPGENKHPSVYLTWISEMMLQQTGASTVVPYFNAFIQSFPTLHHLADASIHHVLMHWQGLGYYRRAYHLHQAAKAMVLYGIPETYEGWLALPGIGPYTAAAITTIGQNQSAVAVDGNIRRLFSRCFGIDGPEWVKAIGHKAAIELPHERWGDYTQGLMDLGATLCKPKNPQCMDCPLVHQCHGFSVGTPMLWPPKTVKVQKKNQFGHVYVMVDQQTQRIWIEPTPENELLAGLWRFPGSSWASNRPPKPQGYRFLGTLVHLFTHIRLQLTIWGYRWGDDKPTMPQFSFLRRGNDSAVLEDGQNPPFTLQNPDQIEESGNVHGVWISQDTVLPIHPTQSNKPVGQWVDWDQINQYPLSTLMRNVLQQARDWMMGAP